MSKKTNRLLIVDDDPNNRFALSLRLKKIGYKDFAEAINGKEALDAMRQSPFDLILLDVNMPVMDGIECLKEIRQDPQLRDIPVIVASAADDIDQVVTCIELGAEDYLTKPINPVILKARINASLERKKLHEKELEYFDRLHESEKIAALGNITVGMAHEMNTPIGVCISAISYLIQQTNELVDAVQENNLTRTTLTSYCEDTLESAKIIEKNLKQAAQHISNFKSVAVERHTESIEHFNVAEFIDSIMQLIANRAEQEQCKLNYHCDKHITMYSYPHALHQILVHLTNNSFSHAFHQISNKCISVTIEQLENKLQVTYQDNGNGIAPELQGKLFSPFVSTNHTGNHLGLGLNIIYNLVKQILKGHINYQPNTPHGVIFTIELPLNPEQVE